MTKYHYCLLLMGSLLLGSCQSVEQLSIDYMLPAEVSFPGNIETCGCCQQHAKRTGQQTHHQ